MGAQTGPNPVDRAKPGSKHHVLTDADGIPLVTAISAANHHDSRYLFPLLIGLPPRLRAKIVSLFADRAYDSDASRLPLPRGLFDRCTSSQILFLLDALSIPFGVIGVLSLSGPGELDAMRECSGYLKSSYGATNKGWELSARSADTGLDDYFIDYRYDDHKGTLRATWKGDHYIFIEEKPPPK